MNGIIPLKKELGMTSADCVYKLRKILHERKIGHTGTLDPQVDGVLPICVGQATKLVNLMTSSPKEYTGEITLGFSTTTEDREGDIVESLKLDSNSVSVDQIDSMLNSFVGELKQIPPMFSAVKVNGKKLYEYARANESVERPVRNVIIYKFSRTSDLKFNEDNKTITFKFDVECSKGTYVRTLAVQLGESFNIPAHMSQLTRIKSAGINIDKTYTLSEIESMFKEDNLTFLDSIEDVLFNYPIINLKDNEWSIVQNGAFVKLDTKENTVALSYNNKIKALYKLNEYGKYQPEIMLLNND